MLHQVIAPNFSDCTRLEEGDKNWFSVPQERENLLALIWNGKPKSQHKY